MSYFNPPSEQLPPPSFFSIKQCGLLQSWKTWMYEEAYFLFFFLISFFIFIFLLIFLIFNFIILSYN